ncbi:MAG: metallophosphoesterase, partial [Candidatus Omnitrophota bacterium]
LKSVLGRYKGELNVLPDSVKAIITAATKQSAIEHFRAFGTQGVAEVVGGYSVRQREQNNILEKIGFTFKDNPQERKEQIKLLLGEIDKELVRPGTGNLPTIAYISDYHGGIERFLALLSDALYQLSGFKGTLNTELSVEEQLQAQGLSLKTIKGALYLNGDLLDRGPYGMKCFNTVKELLETAPDRVFYVSGNHDFWAFGNLLGIHLPWYQGFNFYGDKEAEGLIDAHRRTEPGLFDDFKGFLWWTERLAEFNDDQNKFQKEFLEGRAEDIRKKFIERYDAYSNQWNATQLDAMEDFIGHFKRIDVPDPYAGLRGMGNTSSIWWKRVIQQLIHGHSARSEIGAKEDELAIWQEAISLASQIKTEVERRLNQALSEGKWWYRIFESINTQPYESVEWWCKDWSSHKGWGEQVIRELAEINKEKLTQKNYITSPTLKDLAHFYRSNFNLYIKNPYGGLMSHGWFPVEGDGNIVITYKGKQYTQKEIFEGFDAISADVKNTERSLHEIWEAMHLVNSFYADKVIRIKPTHVRDYIKMGVAKIQSKIGAAQWFTGHNPLNKLKIPFMVRDADYAHFSIDKGMADAFGGEGAYALAGPQGVILRGFETKDNLNIIDSPKTIVVDKKKPEPVVIENRGMPAKEFLETTKAFLERELAALESAYQTSLTGRSLYDALKASGLGKIVARGNKEFRDHDFGKSAVTMCTNIRTPLSLDGIMQAAKETNSVAILQQAISEFDYTWPNGYSPDNAFRFAEEAKQAAARNNFFDYILKADHITVKVDKAFLKDQSAQDQLATLLETILAATTNTEREAIFTAAYENKDFMANDNIKNAMKVLKKAVEHTKATVAAGYTIFALDASFMPARLNILATAFLAGFIPANASIEAEVG